MSAQPSKYLTPAQVAAVLETSAKTVLRAVDRGDLQAVRYGRVCRIEQASFDEFLRKHRVVPGRRTA